jgi:hypothetical protein
MEILSSIFYKFFSFINFYFFSGSSLKLRKLAKVHNGDSIYSSASLIIPAYVKVIFHDIIDYKNFIRDVILNSSDIKNWDFYFATVLENNNIVATFHYSNDEKLPDVLSKKYIDLALYSLDIFSNIVESNNILEMKVENNTVITLNGYSYYISGPNKSTTITKDDKKLVTKNESYCLLSNSCFEVLKHMIEKISHQNKILYNIDLDLDNLKSFK